MPEPILETVGISKSFGGFQAVSDVNLKVTEGAIHALLGPNGAGKTTCFNLITGFMKPSAGEVRLRGAPISDLPPAGVARRGLVRSFQISAVFGTLSCLENVRIALQRKHGLFRAFWRPDSALRRFDAEASDLLARVGLSPWMDAAASTLPYGRKRALELATTLALDPQIMLLDEPFAGMAHGDIPSMTDLIRKAAAGKTVLMVEHNMSVVSQLCDRISVMARGRLIAEGTYEQVSRDPVVIEAYLGETH
ncbi:ABC transporter ATP-binding protein [Mesorhizobium sp. CAU 1732]|uniref:ABC transporter ATP-binding protein n=1 Tax=Mesorhizobium sp. CAU 1732 TaxID=3140358 RepID=UPI003260B803